MTIEERQLTIALEHPRGTERRTLLPYREALNDAAAYASLPLADRDAIVRWVEVRRLLKERHGLDHDEANLADPLLPYDALRDAVLAGEIHAGGMRQPDGSGDFRALVRRMRGD